MEEPRRGGFGLNSEDISWAWLIWTFNIVIQCGFRLFDIGLRDAALPFFHRVFYAQDTGFEIWDSVLSLMA